MQSKQGKRGKSAKQVRRVAAAVATLERKANARTNRKSKSARDGVRSRESLKMVAAPIATSAIRRDFFGFRFGSAPAHDEFPEGGLRISGTLPGTSASGSVVNDTVSLGIFGTAGLLGIAVEPSGATIGTGVGALFSSTGPLAVFSTFFRRYRFRKLEAEYNGILPTSSVDNKLIQISYERDPWCGGTTAYNITGAVTAQTTRFNGWVPEVRMPLIDSRIASRDDELFWTGSAADGMSISGSAADIRQRVQGVVLGLTTSIAPAEVVFGNIIYRFTVDLYGFTNQSGTGVPMKTLRLSQEQELKRVELPRTVDLRHTVQPEREGFDFVDLTPRSKRERDEKTPPPSVRASSEKGSRRA